MKRERGLWRDIAPLLGTLGAVVRVENPIGPGTPDVVYALRWQGRAAQGWLELKHEVAFPARESTTFRIASLTKDQVLWQEAWGAAGERVLTLLRVGNKHGWHLFLRPAELRDVYEGRHTAHSLLEATKERTTRGIILGVWARCLTET
jgi:hypothetical protein